MENKNLEVFSDAPVPKAVLKNVLPAMAAMVMVLIYNLADTFFIGQTHNDILVAAVSLATPVFLVFMSFGTVFGIGGTSVISRALGEGRTDYAKKVCSFCMWCCVGIGVVISVLLLVFMKQVLALAGANPDTAGEARVYLSIVGCGTMFTLISGCFSNILRAEGQPGKAMVGQVMGNILNIILDPVLILLFDWGIAGAAIATVIGNAFGACYYILYYLRGHSSLSIHPKDFSAREGICKAVLVIGVPASLGSLLMSIAQVIVNNQMSNYGDMAVAGMGVAMKVTMITGTACIGMGQGVQPLLGYCVGAKMWERFKKILRFSLVISFAFSTLITLLCYAGSSRIVQVFLTDPTAYGFALQFVRILLTTSFLFGVFFVLSNTLQAMGAATAALIVNLSRQGIVYIPAVFILQKSLCVTGLVWAQPVADLISILLVAVLYVYTIRKMASETRTKVAEVSQNA